MRINSRGQALVEFILILPMILLVMLGVFDYVNISDKKYNLENELDYVSELYKNNQIENINNYASRKSFAFDFKKYSDYAELIISKEVDLIAPGLDKILGDPYLITVKRVVYDE